MYMDAQTCRGWYRLIDTVKCGDLEQGNIWVPDPDRAVIPPGGRCLLASDSGGALAGRDTLRCRRL
jgi:hypothetical protein